MPRIVTPNGYVIDTELLREVFDSICELHDRLVEQHGENYPSAVKVKELAIEMLRLMYQDAELRPIILEALDAAHTR